MSRNQTKRRRHYDDSLYEGDFLDNQLEGIGTLTWPNGDKYEGQFSRDMIWGEGIKTLVDGTTYTSDAFKDGVVRGNTSVKWSPTNDNYAVRKYGDYYGQMKNDAQHGKGKVWLLDDWEGASRNIPLSSYNPEKQSSVYIGDFAFNEIVGRGAFFREDKRKYYEGHVEGAKFHGQGTFYFLAEGHKAKYTGQFSSGAFGGEGERIWEDGRVGKGAFLAGQMNGQGTLRWPSGQLYEGTFAQDKLNGQGKMQMPSEWVYEGNFENDDKAGYGEITWQKVHEPKSDLVAPQIYPGDEDDRHAYKGTWKAGKPTGEGVLTMRDGRSFKAMFVDGQYSGQVQAQWENGRTYEGELLRNKLHGKGKEFKNKTKVTYSGDYKEDQRHGEGEYEVPKEGTYVGSFQFNRRAGKGKLTGLQGEVYNGDWVADLKHGQGTMKWPNGDQYTGGWRDGKQSGRGRFQWGAGGSYEGDWKDSKMHGEGALINAKVGTYKGQFLDHKMDGEGQQVFPDGRKFVGNYAKDKMHGPGTMELPNGMKFIGKYKDGKRLDEGLKILPNGDQLSGTFRGDLWEAYGEAKKTLTSGIELKGFITQDLVTSKAGGPLGSIEWGTAHADYGKYSGAIENDQMHGPGKITMKNGTTLEGEFTRNELPAQGIKVFDGVTLQIVSGAMRGGLFTGVGKLVGLKYSYEGGFVGDQKQGQGVLHVFKDYTYTGAFGKGMKNGKGTLKYEPRPGRKQKQYVGDFTDDRIEGQGEMQLAYGSKQTGAFANGILHGVGSHVAINKDLIHGVYERGVISEGKLTYPNDDFYEGPFLQSKPHGRGKINMRNGVVTGDFLFGACHAGVKDFKHHSWTYYGLLRESKMSGQGICKLFEDEERTILLETVQGQFTSDKFPTQGSKTIHQGFLKGYYTGGMDEFTAAAQGRGKLRLDDRARGVIEGQFDKNVVSGRASQTVEGKWRIEGLFENNQPVDVKYHNWGGAFGIGDKKWNEVAKDKCLKIMVEKAAEARRLKLEKEKEKAERGAAEKKEGEAASESESPSGSEPEEDLFEGGKGN